MQLYEFQAKKVFRQNGIPIPKGRLARTAKDAAKVAEELGDALARARRDERASVAMFFCGWPGSAPC